jgi:hypothetical protein
VGYFDWRGITEGRELRLSCETSFARDVSARDVADALGLKIQTVKLALSRLAHQKKIEKLSSGHLKALGAAS